MNSERISPFYRVKGLLIGNQGVGKSSLVNMFDKNVHDPSITTTIGIDFASFLYELKEYKLTGYLPSYYFDAVDQSEIKNISYCQAIRVALWDSAGSERFTTIIKSYLRDVDFSFLVFDMTNRKSWDDLNKWKRELENQSKHDGLPMIILVGTKSDLNPHVVSREEIAIRCKEWNAKNFIVSCLQQNSPSIIKRMLYITLCNFHENMMLKAYHGESLPKHVTTSYYETQQPLIDIAESSTAFCCTIS